MSELYEIVETGEGEFVLRRAEGDEPPVVVIRFSDEAMAFLSDTRVEVAKSMIEAGIHRVESLVKEDRIQADSQADEDLVGDQTIH